jgi:hypothetical protein
VLSPRLRADRRIFFPWEGRGGLRRYLAVGRFRPVILLGLVVTFLGWVVSRERLASGVRETQVALSLVGPAVERYLLEHEGACPTSLGEVLPFLRKTELPADAWGRSLRLVCPSVRPGADYVLMSDGPDGKAGGLDRIEY